MIYTETANRFLQFIAGKTETLSGTGKCYIGFSSTTPNADGSNFTEPDAATYPSYQRIQVCIADAAAYTDKWGTVADGAVSNAQVLAMELECQEESGWPEWTHFGIFGQKTGGTPLAGDLIRDPDGAVDETTGLKPAKSLKIEHKKVAVFRPGALTLTIT